MGRTCAGPAVDEVKAALGEPPPAEVTVAFDDGTYRIFHRTAEDAGEQR